LDRLRGILEGKKWNSEKALKKQVVVFGPF
jgi:hypothetical protein